MSPVYKQLWSSTIAAEAIYRGKKSSWQEARERQERQRAEEEARQKAEEEEKKKTSWQMPTFRSVGIFDESEYDDEKSKKETKDCGCGK